MVHMSSILKTAVSGTTCFIIIVGISSWSRNLTKQVRIRICHLGEYQDMCNMIKKTQVPSESRICIVVNGQIGRMQRKKRS